MSRHQQPLAADILATGSLREKSKKRKSKDLREDGDGYIDSRSSRKILKIGRELEDEERLATQAPAAKKNPFAFDSRPLDPSNEDEEDRFDDNEEAWEDEDEESTIEDAELDPKDLVMFNKFISPGEEPSLELNSETVTDQGTNLTDLILQQIEAYEAAQETEVGNAKENVEKDENIPEKVVEVFTKIGQILSRYKSGKLPKPFKVLPTLPRWEDLLAITRPEAWTPNACYEATRIFIASSPATARKFVEAVLLDRAREDIYETKKLNVHLYNSLKKATYKPAAFFKGFLFPLVESGTCTLREATIVASVITRVSIPVLHSAAALMRLTDIAAEQASMSTEGGGATNIFIRAFLEKKYALPYKVIDNLVFHFLRFRAAAENGTHHQHAEEFSSNGNGGGGSRIGGGAGARTVQGSNEQQQLQLQKLPVLWHQSLLAFAQRYRNDITEDQREALLDLLLLRGHKDIGPEVRRELLLGRGRGMPVTAETAQALEAMTVDA